MDMSTKIAPESDRPSHIKKPKTKKSKNTKGKVVGEEGEGMASETKKKRRKVNKKRLIMNVA
jgi:hypothetical protein